MSGALLDQQGNTATTTTTTTTPVFLSHEGGDREPACVAVLAPPTPASPPPKGIMSTQKRRRCAAEDDARVEEGSAEGPATNGGGPGAGRSSSSSGGGGGGGGGVVRAKVVARNEVSLEIIYKVIVSPGGVDTWIGCCLPIVAQNECSSEEGEDSKSTKKKSKLSKKLDLYGLCDDCEVFPRLFDYCLAIAGGTLQACRELIHGRSSISIHWNGGRHHVVLGILLLQQHFSRVMYIDIDIHHADGVQDAFYCSDHVLKISFHKFLPGFFPGTGQASESGSSKGSHFNINVPLPTENMDDSTYIQVFEAVVSAAKEKFVPKVLVLTCGVDTLAEDPIGGWNMTIDGIAKCIAIVLGWKIPTLLLGGGGYNDVNSARCYALCTSVAINSVADGSPETPEHHSNDSNNRPTLVHDGGTSSNTATVPEDIYPASHPPLPQLPEHIPEHEYWPLYGPEFTLHTSSIRMHSHQNIHQQEQEQQPPSSSSTTCACVATPTGTHLTSLARDAIMQAKSHINLITPPHKLRT
ncbi:histone deacetylase 9 [Pelomyxa schiedti]|nr:histone deacetylase 9 [Pelomyxa schiedti]